MTKILAPTEEDIQTLRESVQEAKRIQQFHELKDELVATTEKPLLKPGEFEGVMRVSDVNRLLHSKRKGFQLVEMVFTRLRGMFSVKPIIGNLIALAVLLSSINTMYHVELSEFFQEIRPFLMNGMLIIGALQIVKSGARSLFLPTLAIVVGYTASNSLGDSGALLQLSHDHYQYMMVTGIIGLGISAITID